MPGKVTQKDLEELDRLDAEADEALTGKKKPKEITIPEVVIGGNEPPKENKGIVLPEVVIENDRPQPTEADLKALEQEDQKPQQGLQSLQQPQAPAGWPGVVLVKEDGTRVPVPPPGQETDLWQVQANEQAARQAGLVYPGKQPDPTLTAAGVPLEAQTNRVREAVARAEQVTQKPTLNVAMIGPDGKTRFVVHSVDDVKRMQESGYRIAPDNDPAQMATLQQEKAKDQQAPLEAIESAEPSKPLEAVVEPNGLPPKTVQGQVSERGGQEAREAYGGLKEATSQASAALQDAALARSEESFEKLRAASWQLDDKINALLDADQQLRQYYKDVETLEAQQPPEKSNIVAGIMMALTSLAGRPDLGFAMFRAWKNGFRKDVARMVLAKGFSQKSALQALQLSQQVANLRAAKYLSDAQEVIERKLGSDGLSPQDRAALRMQWLRLQKEKLQAAESLGTVSRGEVYGYQKVRRGKGGGGSSGSGSRYIPSGDEPTEADFGTGKVKRIGNTCIETIPIKQSKNEVRVRNPDGTTYLINRADKELYKLGRKRQAELLPAAENLLRALKTVQAKYKKMGKTRAAVDLLLGRNLGYLQKPLLEFNKKAAGDHSITKESEFNRDLSAAGLGTKDLVTGMMLDKTAIDKAVNIMETNVRVIKKTINELLPSVHNNLGIPVKEARDGRLFRIVPCPEQTTEGPGPAYRAPKPAPKPVTAPKPTPAKPKIYRGEPIE